MYSGADIENVVEVATENVITEIMNTNTQRCIEMRDLLQAIEKTKPSTLEWLKTINNYVKYANQTGLYDDVDQYIRKHRKLI
jgi:SpoVK/Ycf46/Vps4 family AAA+-type ATPase